jgi:hypothetical protein
MQYASQQMGLGTSTTKHQCIGCEVCGASLVAESLRSHLETQHNIFWLFVLNRDIVVACPPEVYRATELPATGMYFCPVPQCSGQSGTRFNLPHHFHMQHPQYLVCIPIEGSQPLPQCKHCDCRHRLRASMEATTAQSCVRGMGEETATCGCRSFPGGPLTFVYGVRGRTGEGGHFQVLRAAHHL